MFWNLETYRVKSLKKKNSDEVIFSEPAGFPPAIFQKIIYVGRFQDSTFFKKDLL